MRAAIALLLALATAPLTAQVRPQPGDGDPRLQSVEYRSNQVVQIEAAPGYQVTLELAPDEQIENVAVGDSGAWQVTANRRGNLLFVKPLMGNVSTNMTVLTSARLYLFELAPLGGASDSMAYWVRFTYPREGDGEDQGNASTEPDEGRYRLSGDRSLRPTGISDDGQRTYIEWPEDLPLPAVYAIDINGREALVNGMMRGELYVVDSVHRQLIFRIDRRVARARRLEPL